MSSTIAITKGGHMARVDLDHAQQEATSLKRFATQHGWTDVAEVADLMLRLVAEVRAGMAGLSENVLREITRVRGDNAELRRRLSDTEAQLEHAYRKLRELRKEQP